MPSVPSGLRGARITGWGSALPDKIVTNDDLAAGGLDTNDQWIRERTGIRERRIGGSTSSLSIESGRKAIEAAGIDPASIDAVILATTTPDRMVPASAPSVQKELGLTCGAFDLNAACAGFVYGLVVAHGLIGAGMNNVLVIGTDTLSRITDYQDRGTGILFADGSAAVVLQATEGPGQLLGWDLNADGSAEEALYCDHGSKLHMDGKEVFRRAVLIMADSGNKSLKAAGVSIDDISLIIPHQANTRIIEAACKRLGAPFEKCSIVLDVTGNTSAATVPLALVQAIEDGRVHDGDLILFVGFGAGMTAASAVIRWGAL